MASPLRKRVEFISPKWLAAKWSHQPSFMNNENLKIISSKNDVNYMWSKYLKVIIILYLMKVFWRC